MVKLFGGNGLFSTLGNMGIDPLGKSGKDVTAYLYKEQLLHPKDLKFKIFSSPDMATFMKSYGKVHSFGEIDPNKDPKGYNLMLKALGSVNQGNFRYALSKPDTLTPQIHTVVKTLIPRPNPPITEHYQVIKKPALHTSHPVVKVTHKPPTHPVTRQVPKQAPRKVVPKVTPPVKHSIPPVKSGLLHTPAKLTLVDNGGYIDLGNSTNPELRQQANQVWNEIIGNTTTQTQEGTDQINSHNLRLFIPGAHKMNFQTLGSSDSVSDKSNLINRVSGNGITNPGGKTLNSYVTPLKVGNNVDQTYNPFTPANIYPTDDSSKVLVIDSHGGFAMEYIDQSTHPDAYANFLEYINFLHKGSPLEVLADIKDSTGHISTYSIEYEVVANVHNYPLPVPAGQNGQYTWYDFGNLAKLDLKGIYDGSAINKQNPLVLVSCEGYDFDDANSGPGKGLQFAIAIPFRILKITNTDEFIHKTELAAA